VGGDGTLNGLPPLAERLPTVLAPKTIDNDLGLNYPDEPDKWVRVPEPNKLNSRQVLALVEPSSTRYEPNT
jgi:hypothetical protein